MARSTHADKEALNVRHLPHHRTTKSGGTHEGLMSRSQPEVVNGFIGMEKNDGAWIYLTPGASNATSG